MLPKKMLLQNRTLEIHVATPTLSTLNTPASMAAGSGCAFCIAGGGIEFGLMPMTRIEPTKATAIDSRNPAFVRSIKYHMAGFTSASVSDT